MKNSNIELNDFCVRKLNIGWLDGQSQDKVEQSVKLGFDFDLSAHKSNSNQFKLIFRLKGEPEAGYEGLEFETEIHGFFSFPKGEKKETMHYLLAVNGMTILYGLLRGQLSMVSGAFPCGKFTLPAVIMAEIVPEIIAKKQIPGKKSKKTADKKLIKFK